jgi:hypothetical protein
MEVEGDIPPARIADIAAAAAGLMFDGLADRERPTCYLLAGL